MLLRTDGCLLYIGDDVDYAALAGGSAHAIILRSGGHAVSFGRNKCGPYEIPAFLFKRSWEPARRMLGIVSWWFEIWIQIVYDVAKSILNQTFETLARGL